MNIDKRLERFQKVDMTDGQRAELLRRWALHLEREQSRLNDSTQWGRP